MRSERSGGLGGPEGWGRGSVRSGAFKRSGKSGWSNRAVRSEKLVRRSGRSGKSVRSDAFRWSEKSE